MHKFPRPARTRHDRPSSDHFAACAVALTVAWLLPGVAAAQDAATAEALFERGLADMKAGKLDNACPALAESHRIDPRPGTLFTLADCEAKWGKLTSAFARYGDYAALVGRLPADQQANHRDRQKLAAARRAELSRRIPLLTLVLPITAPRGTEVRRGELVLGEPALGVPLPVDPGEHVVTTRTPAGVERVHRIALAEGERKTLELSTEAAAVAPPVSAPPAAERAPEPQKGSQRRTYALVAGGIGAAGLVVGGVTGFLALGKKSTVDQNCVDVVCNAQGKSAADSARSLATISTVGFAVGLIGAGVGAALWLTSPPEAASSGRLQVGGAALGPRDGMITLRRSF